VRRGRKRLMASRDESDGDNCWYSGAHREIICRDNNDIDISASYFFQNTGGALLHLARRNRLNNRASLISCAIAFDALRNRTRLGRSRPQMRLIS
jgi:hypothetical protein